MLPVIKQKLKKQTSPVKKITKASNSLRFLRRKKLIALTIRLRREARLLRFRSRQRHLLWKAARPYLRVDASNALRTKSNYLFAIRLAHKKMTKHLSLARSAIRSLLCRRGVSRRSAKARAQLTKRITVLSSTLGAQHATSIAQIAQSAIGGVFKTKISTTLLRRKQRRYKKLTYLFLKTSRLRWLRKSHPTRQKKHQLRKARHVARKTWRVNTISGLLQLQVPTKMRGVYFRSSVKGVIGLANPTKIRYGRKDLPATRKSIFWDKRRSAVKRWKCLQQIKRVLARNASSARRRTSISRTLARKAKLLRRARLSTRIRPVARRYRRKLKSRKLKIRRGRWTRLLLRRKHYRRYRKLRQVAGKRLTVRNRRAILLAKSQPIRRHLYYKRLLLTQRIGVAIQQLRSLRDTNPQDVRRKQLCHAAAVIGNWRSELVHLTPPAPRALLIHNRGKRCVNSKKEVIAPAKKRLPVAPRKRAVLPTKNRVTAQPKKKAVALAKKPQTSKAKAPGKGRRRPGRRARAIAKARKRTAKGKRLPALAKGKKRSATVKSQKTRQLGPRTRMQALVQRAAVGLRAVNKYKKLLATAKYRARRHLYSSTPRLAQHGYRATCQLPMQALIAPFSRITLQRKRHKRVAYGKAINTARTVLASAKKKLQRATQRVHSRRAHNIYRAIYMIKRTVQRYKINLASAVGLARAAKGVSVQRKRITPPYKLSATEQQRLRLTPGLRTLSGRQLLIHRYRLAGHFPRTHLYDPRPRVLHAIGRQFIRKSLRYKRRLAKRARAVIPKSKRKLRRRTRKKIVILGKRTYSYTNRSPVHVGRTVPWREMAKYRGQHYSRLISTRRAFKRLLRAKYTAVQLPATPAHRQKRAEQLGRTLLWVLLRFTAKVQSSDKNTQLVFRLRTVIRLFLRRKSLPTGPGMRLLILKTLTTSIGESRAQKRQLLDLEHRWLLAGSLRCVTRARKTIRAHIRLKRLARSYRRNMPRFKQRKSRKSLSTAFLHRRLFALPRKVLRRANLFIRAYPKKVKRLISKRKFAVLIRRLRPTRWHSKKGRIRLRKKRVATRHSWRRIRLYRKARRFTIRFVSRRLRTRIRCGERCAIHFRSTQLRRISTSRKLYRGTRPPLHTPLRTSRKLPTVADLLKRRLTPRKQPLATVPAKLRLRSFKVNFHQTVFLRNKKAQLTRSASRHLFARLDSSRLRAKKALLWKAPLQTVPVSTASVVSPAQRKQSENWYRYPVANQKAALKLGHQELRRLLLVTGPILSVQPLAPIPICHWRATRISRRYSISEVSREVFKRSRVATTHKKLQPRGRISKIGRIARRPRIIPFWIKKHPRYKKKQKAKLARLFRLPPVRIRALRKRPFRRTIFFRKKRLFMRRRTTLGLKELPKGGLLKLPGFRLLVIRPLRARLRRNKPLRRSLRRQLALNRQVRRKPRYKKVQASTGRVLSTLRPAPRQGRVFWRRMAIRAGYPVTGQKLQIVDQLLKQFDHLSAASPIVIHHTAKLAVAAIKVPSRTRRKAVSPLRFLLRTQQHFNVINRRTTTTRRTVTAPKMFTLRTGHRVTIRLRRRITTTRSRNMPPRFTTVQRGKRGRNVKLPILVYNGRESRLHSLYPRLTPGKIERKIRLERQSRYHPFRSIKGSFILPSPDKLRRLHISSPRVGLLGAMTYRSTRKPVLAKVRRKLTRVKIRGKRIFRQAKCTVGITQAKLAKNKKLPTRTAKELSAWVKKVIASIKKRPHGKAATMSRQNLRKPTNAINRPTIKLKTWVNAANNSKPQPKTVGPTISTTAIKAPALTKFTPSKQQLSSSHQIHEPTLSAVLAKKITTFNKEVDAQTEKAYNAVMSGLKASWTQLQDDASTVPLAQRKTDVEIMEKVYTRYYAPVVRFNSKAILDFKRYKATLAATASVIASKK